MADEWFDAGAALPGLRGTAVHVLPSLREEEVRAALRAAGFRVREIDGGQVRDEPSFFDEAARAFLWPAHFGRNWDALQDALGDLAESQDRRVALLWRDAGTSFGGDPQTVVDAFLALARAADDLGGEDPPTQLEVFLFSDQAPLPMAGRVRKTRR